LSGEQGANRDQLGVIDMLTFREREILGFISSGPSYEQIGEKLSINKYSVMEHASRIRTKLDAAVNRTDDQR